ncbi:MAG: hypothetical protein KDF60_16745 [Calditrichaeota bacterium]|nr:hypothetical protein [Calditrichota bacterium]
MSCNKICRVFNTGTLLFLNRLLIAALFLSPVITNASTYSTKILSRTATSIKIKVNFDKPDLNTESGKEYLYFENSSFTFDNTGVQVPVVSKMINLSGRQASVRIISKKVNRIESVNPVLGKPQKSDNADALINYIGLYRELAVFSLEIYPVHYSNELKSFEWTEEIIVEVNSISDSNISKSTYTADKKESSFLNAFFLNDNQTFYKDSQQNTLNKIGSWNPLPGNYQVLYKITLEETGIYKITYSDLVDAEFPVDFVNPKNLAIFNKGQEIPVYFKGAEDNRLDPNDYFEFWGEKNEKTFINQYPDLYSDPFSDKNVYWLVEKNTSAKRLVEESGGINETNPARFLTPFKYTETLHFEKDTHRQLFGKNPEYMNEPSYKFDRWFWGNVINSVESRTFDFYLPYPYPTGSTVYATAMFRGVSIYDSQTNPLQGHQVAAWINDLKVGEIQPAQRWSGQKMAKLNNSTPLPQSNLHHGNNVFRIDMEQIGVTDIVLFNWFDITYDRRYRADNNFIKFRLQRDLFDENKTIQFEIDGFKSSDISIYKLGISKIVNGQIADIVSNIDGLRSYQIKIQDRVYDPNIEYIAVTEKAKKKPISINAYHPWKESNPLQTIAKTGNIADVLIISTELFAEQVERLKSLKESAGFNVETVNVEHIYDIFNYGIKSPLAIKEFLAYAYNNWDESSKLKYVILVGDASYDYKEKLRDTNDFVPTIFYTTSEFGAAPADIQYAFISGDDNIPDISIGRIPASSTEELAYYIDKVEFYQNDVTPQKWRDNALFISGFDAGSGDREYFTDKPIFRAQNNRIIDLKLPQSVFAYKLNTQKNDSIAGFDPDYGGNRELIDYFDDGLTFVNFFGHGGGAIWADQQLFDLHHVDNLNNEGMYPFISSMTCFTGAFENPNKEGLAEKILMAERKGAIAVLASGSVGWKYNDFAVKWALHDYLWKDGISFGEAVDLMKINYLSNPIYYTEEGASSTPSFYSLRHSMINQYNLLGDPTLELQKPDNKLEIGLSSKTPAEGQQVKISINSPELSGSGNIEISDKNNVKYLEQSFGFNNGNYSLDFNIPDSSSGKFLKVKAYTTDGETDASGFNTMFIERPVIKKIVINPQSPKVNEAINFSVTVNSYKAIMKMELRKFRDANLLSSNKTFIEMQQVNDSLFQSLQGYPGFSGEGLKYYEVYVMDSDSNENIYDLQEIHVGDDRPDLAADANSISFSGNDQLQLKFNIINDSEIPLQNVRVSCYDAQGINDTVAFYSNQYSFSPNETKTIFVPYTSSRTPQTQIFRVVADVNNEIEEKDEANNIANKLLTADHVWIDYRVGSSIDGSANIPVSVNTNWNFFVEKEAINASSVFEFERINVYDLIVHGDQKDLKFLSLLSQTDTSALKISIKNSTTTFSKPAVLSADLDTSLYSLQVLNTASFFRFNTYLGLWVKQTSSLENTKLSTEITESGLYAVFSFTDETNPFIEITANGRPLKKDMLIRSNPSIAMLLQDENGIDLQNSFQARLNGAPISLEDLTIPDSLSNANSIAVLATPELEKGVHTLDVEVADVNGNVSSTSITFSVSANNQLIVHGNYPNPFSDRTIISYTASFSNRMDNLSVKIYSVSGHLVRSKILSPPEDETDDILDTGYHELEWDGSDDNGNQVANGVYFVVIKAKFKDTFENKTYSFTKKLKVARLK